jgi:hypothetical protein
MELDVVVIGALNPPLLMLLPLSISWILAKIISCCLGSIVEFAGEARMGVIGVRANEGSEGRPMNLAEGTGPSESEETAAVVFWVILVLVFVMGSIFDRPEEVS